MFGADEKKKQRLKKTPALRRLFKIYTDACRKCEEEQEPKTCFGLTAVEKRQSPI